MTRLQTRSLGIALAVTCSLATASCGSDAKTSAGSLAPSTVASTTATTQAGTPSTAATTATTGAPPTAASSASSDSTAAAAAAGATVQLVDSPLGKILADAEGRTLYLFTKDAAGASVCAGGCATAWPPLTGPAIPGAGLGAEDFAAIPRDDGTTQATFYGHPLYTYAGDAKPGDVTGQGSNGVWYVVGADGTAIETAPSIPGY